MRRVLILAVLLALGLVAGTSTGDTTGRCPPHCITAVVSTITTLATTATRTVTQRMRSTIMSVVTRRVTGPTAAVVTTAPAPPPPTTTAVGPITRQAQPGQVVRVIAESKPGDTVVAFGAQPKLILDRDVPGGQVTIRSAAGSSFAGIDTNGHSGYDFEGVTSVVPVELADYDKPAFYLDGASSRITLGGGSVIRGGYDGIKQYGHGAGNVIDGVDVSGVGGDLIHVNGAVDLTIRNASLHDPVDQGQEHHDGIQVQAVDGLRVGPGVEISWPVTPRRDSPDNGVIVNCPAGACKGLVFDGVSVEQWWGGRAFQLLAADDAVVRRLVVEDSGNGANSPPVTVDAFAGARYDLHGVNPSDVWSARRLDVEPPSTASALAGAPS